MYLNFINTFSILKENEQYENAKRILDEFVTNHNNNISNAEPDPSAVHSLNIHIVLNVL